MSCHYDITEWLEPDWVLDMQTRTLARRRLRRPEIHLELFRADGQSPWQLFKKTHYLSAGLSKGCSLYVALWENRPVACVGVINAFGVRAPGVEAMHRISRVVVLPDFQGVGIGRHVTAAVAELYATQRRSRVSIVSAHPSMIAIQPDQGIHLLQCGRESGGKYGH